MKNSFPIILFLLLFGTTTITAQYQIGLIPALSPSKTVSAKISYTDISLTYSSPKVNERDIWGALISYDEIWRAGADYATTFSVSHDVFLNGNLLPKGKYSLFVIPRKEKRWTVIFNKVARQWGAYKFDEKENILQFDVPAQSNEFQEELNYNIIDRGNGMGSVELTWEKIKLQFAFNCSFLDQLKEQVKNRTDTLPQHSKYMPYLQSAQYLINNSDEIELASEWINKSAELWEPEGPWNDAFYSKVYVEDHIEWIQAKVLARQGEFKKAMAIVTELKKGTEAQTFYNYMGKRDKVDLYEKAWKDGKNLKLIL